MATVFTLQGAFGLHSMTRRNLQGAVTEGHEVVVVEYPNGGIDSWRMEQGRDMLNAAIEDTPGKKIVLAMSMGARAAGWWLHDYGPNSDIPPGELEFVLCGNSERKYGGWVRATANWWARPIPEDTPYKVTDIARQYDGWADWPSNWLALFSMMNALAGRANVHNYYDVPLDSPANVSHVEGNITYVWAPTYPVPLLGTIAHTWLEPWDTLWRPTIEQGYNRPVVIPSP